jgi:tetratricopeptide (TPR) repeat protein
MRRVGNVSAPWSAPWRAAIFVGVALGGIGFLPLFGGPGYEAALAAGLVLPITVAIASSSMARPSGEAPLVSLGRGALLGAGLTILALLVTLLHGVRAGLCDPIEGLVFFGLGPGMGAVLAGLWGASAGVVGSAIFRKRAPLFVLAALGPLAGIAISIGRFYTSPMVFAFDPFFGFFAGTLYDTVITAGDRLWSYRGGSAMTVLGVVVLAAHLERDEPSKLRWQWRHPGLTALGSAALFGSLVHASLGPELGHHQSAASIRSALGNAARSRRCEVLYSSNTPSREAHALAIECDAHVAELETLFEVVAPERITVYVFDSAEHKGWLMGAARVFVAKPWRDEIYIQGAGFPHRVLRHELAHVIAGAFGRGPFRVAGPLGGWIPDPGRIEGIAEAAAPRDDELGVREWASAMRQLELLPPLSRVFKLSFLGEPASRAYTVAGAFVDWLKEAHGVEVVKRWYGGETLPALTGGKSLQALEREFHAALDAAPVPEKALNVARARFDRPSVFGRRCPRVVDRLRQRAHHFLGQRDIDQARARFRDVLDLDPSNLDARFGLATCALREGDTAGALRAHATLAADEDLPAASRTDAREAIGDIHLRLGEAKEALREYDAVAAALLDEDRLRALDVKRYAAKVPSARPAIVAYLMGDPELGRSETLAASELGRLSVSEPASGLADYLLARSLWNQGRLPDAWRHIEEARGRKLPSERIDREALRVQIVLSCALGNRGAAKRGWQELSQDKALRGARRSYVEAFVERCTRDPESGRK